MPNPQTSPPLELAHAVEPVVVALAREQWPIPVDGRDEVFGRAGVVPTRDGSVVPRHGPRSLRGLWQAEDGCMLDIAFNLGAGGEELGPEVDVAYAWLAAALTDRWGTATALPTDDDIGGERWRWDTPTAEVVVDHGTAGEFRFLTVEVRAPEDPVAGAAGGTAGAADEQAPLPAVSPAEGLTQAGRSDLEPSETTPPSGTTPPSELGPHGGAAEPRPTRGPGPSTTEPGSMLTPAAAADLVASVAVAGWPSNVAALAGWLPRAGLASGPGPGPTMDGATDDRAPAGATGGELRVIAHPQVVGRWTEERGRVTGLFLVLTAAPATGPEPPLAVADEWFVATCEALRDQWGMPHPAGPGPQVAWGAQSEESAGESWVVVGRQRAADGQGELVTALFGPTDGPRPLAPGDVTALVERLGDRPWPVAPDDRRDLFSALSMLEEATFGQPPAMGLIRTAEGWPGSWGSQDGEFGAVSVMPARLPGALLPAVADFYRACVEDLTTSLGDPTVEDETVTVWAAQETYVRLAVAAAGTDAVLDVAVYPPGITYPAPDPDPGGE